jgi:hypothetical protein
VRYKAAYQVPSAKQAADQPSSQVAVVLSEVLVVAGVSAEMASSAPSEEPSNHTFGWRSVREAIPFGCVFTKYCGGLTMGCDDWQGSSSGSEPVAAFVGVVILDASFSA